MRWIVWAAQSSRTLIRSCGGASGPWIGGRWLSLCTGFRAGASALSARWVSTWTTTASPLFVVFSPAVTARRCSGDWCAGGGEGIATAVPITLNCAGVAERAAGPNRTDLRRAAGNASCLFSKAAMEEIDEEGPGAAAVSSAAALATSETMAPPPPPPASSGAAVDPPPTGAASVDAAANVGCSAAD